MASNYRGLGKVRAHGKARIAITLEARDEEEFLRRWHKPAYDYPFEWESGQKFCVEYRVADFAAEVGFYVDVLGINVDAISPSRAQFSSPDQDLVLAVAAGDERQPIHPPDNLRLQMFIKNLETTVAELEKRGVVFESPAEPSSSDPNLLVATLQTPNGLSIELWGYRQVAHPSPTPAHSTRFVSQVDVELEDASEDEIEEEDEDEQQSPAHLPLFSSRPITIEDLEDELEEDARELSSSRTDLNENPDLVDEDQLELGLGLLDDGQEENEEDDEDERLERFLRASTRPAAYTFDERVEPVQDQKPDRMPRTVPVKNQGRLRRSGRISTNVNLPGRVSRQQPPQRSGHRAEPPLVEPTYDDIEEQDHIP